MKNKTLLIIISIVILLIILPLLKPGYIFSLDQVLNPNGWLPKIGGNIYSIGLISQVFSFLHIPIWILEKILIILTFILPSIGGYLLLRNTTSEKVNIGILFAVLLLIFNPFLYARFLDGQINVYLSYSLYPLFFYFLKDSLENYNIKKVLIVGVWSLLLCLTSIHNAIFLFIIGIVFGGFYLSSTGIKKTGTIALSLIFCNSLWVIPFFFSKHEKFELTKQIDNFGIENREAFKTQASDSNVYLNTLSMHGYWGESQYRFSTTQDINENYQRLFILLFVIVLLGIYSRTREKNFGALEYSLLTLAITSYILSLGVSGNNIFSPMSTFLYEYFPFYKGFREPQKWVIFLVIFYAYFGKYGIDYIAKLLEKSPIKTVVQKIVIYCVVGIPIFYSFQMLGGFSGQISIQKYPRQWEEIKDMILEENNNFDKNCEKAIKGESNKCYKTLSLPWHSYMHLKFTGKVVGGWIVRYFGENILIADNLEYGGIYSQSTRPESKIIEKYMGPNGLFKDTENIQESNLALFKSDLQGLGIQNILFLKEADYKWYGEFLEILKTQSIIRIESENEMIILYKLTK